MEIIEIKDVLKLVLNSKFIGYGSTCFCFLMPNGDVLKLFRDTYNKNKLFLSRKMPDHLYLLNTLNNDSYRGPEKIFMRDNLIIGYSYKYIHAKTLANIKKNISTNEIVKSLDKLIEDTYLISDKRFLLGDLHDKNILYQKVFSIIDLDYGLINGTSAIDEIAQANIHYLLKIILNSLLDVEIDEIIHIYSLELQKLYDKTVYEDYRYVQEFFDAICEELKTKDLTVGKLKRNRYKLAYKTQNSYFKLD